jgi:hypothetical protein
MEDAREVNININVVKQETEEQMETKSEQADRTWREFRWKIVAQIAVTTVVVAVAVILLVTSGGAVSGATVGYTVIAAIAGLYSPSPKWK